jgi:hydrogenase expression/formation protein HypC
MCLGIPMRVKKIKEDFADVELGRLIRTINIQLLPQIKVGDYCIVHAGFAIQKVDPERAKATLKIIDEIH